MIVFTAPIKDGFYGKIGKAKIFASAQEIKKFEINEYYDKQPRVEVQVGYIGLTTYPNTEIAEKHVREAIEAIMRDEDYEFPDYEEQ